MGSSLNEGPSFGIVPHPYRKDPERDSNVKSYLFMSQIRLAP